jgi:hypothetical protein
VTGLLREACHRAGRFGPHPSARNDDAATGRERVLTMCHRKFLAFESAILVKIICEIKNKTDDYLSRV